MQNGVFGRLKLFKTRFFGWEFCARRAFWPARVVQLREWLIFLLVAVAGLGAPAAHAQDNPGLYQATAIVTGNDMRQRPEGFADCLKEVLVKVSGDPKLVDDPKVAALAQHADTMVASFAYVDPRAWFLHHDDQGTYDRSYELTVHFDPAKIDQALVMLGIQPWRAARPLLTPIILVRQDENPFLLSAETDRGWEMRQAIVRVASTYGFGVHFPTEDDLAAWGVGLIGFPAPLGAPNPAQLQITGSLNWNVQAMGWIGTWQVRVDGVDHGWDIKGVGFDQAFANMVRGAVMLAHGGGEP